MKSAVPTFIRLKAHFSNWREWELNPVVVKELRQSVRSWAVTGMLLLFLAVLFCTALTFLVRQSFEISVDQRLGSTIFQVFTGILTGASLLFIPLYIGIRLAAERQDANLDLLYISTLTPERIIRGKFFCGAYLIVLFFSACMPFMAFTNLLRGVDLPTVAFILVYLFVVVCAAVQVAIFLACLPISRLFKILIALISLIMLVPIIGGLIANFFMMMRSGVGSMMGGGRFWTSFGIAACMVLAAVVLLYFLSVALISPPSANRALPVRIYLTTVWMIGGLAAGLAALNYPGSHSIKAWCVGTLIVLIFATVVVISNADQLSLRVRRKIPAGGWRRAIAFLFFNGAAGGLVWVGLITFATFGLAATALEAEFMIKVGAAIGYGFAYALTALFIQRKFFPRRPPKLAGIFGILIPGIWALAPNIVLFFMNRLSLHSVENSQLGNVFNVFMVRDTNQQWAHLICAAAWLALVIVLNAKWFSRQWREFRPLEKYVQPEPARAATPPPIPTTTGVLEG
ncbi:MAG TPA: hypothetical protein VFW05_03875 [Verrucomicrobiae bacterium]|jgi:hypothetical protein|nr:hypothetical protein [Verrucomicrobiae bacterium]